LAPVTIVAACDSTGAIVDPEGLDAAASVDAKRSHGSLGELATSSEWNAVETARRAPADVVVQATPSQLDEPAASLAAIEAALSSGKHVVTGAKDALACRPDRVRSLVHASAGRLRASAAVGASVPVLETVEAGFAGDEVEHVPAVLNGSTTFVLSRRKEDAKREEAMASARERGLLEADPTVGLTGLDAAAKAAILHQHVFDSKLSIAEVDVTGVGAVDETACRRARRGGLAIRLLASIDEDGARVAPVEIDDESPLALDGPSCRVQLSLSGAGEVELAGPGAGPTETASAVLADVLKVSSGDSPAGTRAGVSKPGRWHWPSA
jgi:homoserine dehydrogenase